MTDTEMRVLVFRADIDLYGTPLLSVREVLEYQKPKHMPNMAAHFAGVINVRGAVIGVIDLRAKLGYKTEIGPRAALLLCDSERGPLAAIVDGVESVIAVPENHLERKPPVESRTDSRYLIGIAKIETKLITLVDLHLLMLEDRLKAA